MHDYLELVFLLNFVVNFLLIVSTNRLTGFSQRWIRILLASLLGAVYGAVCMIPRMYFLGNAFWRIVFLFMIGMIGFDICIGSVRRCILFGVLSMALGGITTGFNAGGFWEIIALCALLCLLCFIGFHGRAGAKEYINITLRHNSNTMNLTALQDTGNHLCDPITGQSVIILSAEIAKSLLGLTDDQLCNPVETVAKGVISGLRLLPYQTVGRSGDFLLAKRIDYVKIGNWHGSCLVAFSSEKLDREGSYQALTGGIV